jgi:hypothetical protein
VIRPACQSWFDPREYSLISREAAANTSRILVITAIAQGPNGQCREPRALVAVRMLRSLRLQDDRAFPDSWIVRFSKLRVVKRAVRVPEASSLAASP